MLEWQTSWPQTPVFNDMRVQVPSPAPKKRGRHLPSSLFWCRGCADRIATKMAMRSVAKPTSSERSERCSSPVSPHCANACRSFNSPHLMSTEVDVANFGSKSRILNLRIGNAVGGEANNCRDRRPRRSAKRSERCSSPYFIFIHKFFLAFFPNL